LCYSQLSSWPWPWPSHLAMQQTTATRSFRAPTRRAATTARRTTTRTSRRTARRASTTPAAAAECRMHEAMMNGEIPWFDFSRSAAGVYHRAVVIYVAIQRTRYPWMW
ncbi:hypothetical protein BAE44_0013645, partial [Dichanthelium oligosanthes]